ncbi:inositol monophosphatase family protein [Halosimplex salinum]|uniref:inositol monophosphatase family protein n=1 Tax=Halosimplex salinum TaxID=1710538 RepID=UPI000F4A2FCD|nr:inositol monophosphatase [Halosimplex salinum]
MTDAHRRVAVAERAARAGGAVARQSFRGDLAVETKADKNDLVTESDRDAQRQAVSTLRAEFPNDAVVGEEDAVPLGTPGEAVEILSTVPESGDTWVVDPIDGTANFARGLRTWATAISAVVDGEIVAAATYLPATEDVYAAGDGPGTRNGNALAVSDRTDPETFAAAPVGRFERDAGAELGAIAEAVVERLGDFRRFGSMQTTLAFVASGELDAAFATYTPDPWDTLAGIHLVRRAGGTVTDLAGEQWTRESEGIVASNGEAHEVVCEVARAAESR